MELSPDEKQTIKLIFEECYKKFNNEYSCLFSRKAYADSYAVSFDRIFERLCSKFINEINKNISIKMTDFKTDTLSNIYKNIKAKLALFNKRDEELNDIERQIINLHDFYNIYNNKIIYMNTTFNPQNYIFDWIYIKTDNSVEPFGKYLLNIPTIKAILLKYDLLITPEYI